MDEFRLSKTRHLGDPQLAARPEDSISFVHDVARRRGRQLVGDEGEDHEVLRGVDERQRSRVGARVGDPRVVRDNVYPRGILALAKLREPPRHRQPVWKSEFYGAFVLNRRVDLHAIDATPARRRGGVNSSPLDRARTAASSPRNDLVKNFRVHPTHWLISTQTATRIGASSTPANSKSRTACARGGRVDDGLVNDERKHYIHLDAIDAQLLSVCLPMSSSIIHAIDA